MNLLFTTILITNLHPDALPKHLIDAFKQYGEIKKAWIPEKKSYENGVKSSNFGFIQFQNEYDCNSALSAMPPFILDQVVDVHLAKLNPSVRDTLYVTGFSDSTKSSNIISHFKKYNPTDIRILQSKEENKQSYALILFDNEYDRDVAVFNLNDSELDGNKITVKFSMIPFKSHENEL
ncbi:CUGBP Elav-like member 3 [Tritrichomonas musculus]|uniref:CUGBP Elav-like member 3 n=1 Tax=Tritrichomonas musculus TaxID=1915356 RepID=A0ABR2INQ4_9EUKA